METTQGTKRSLSLSFFVLVPHLQPQQPPPTTSSLLSSLMAPTYSLEEVSKHTKSGDIWIAIRGKVYNVTEFVSDHPGGEEVIRDVAGMQIIILFSYSSFLIFFFSFLSSITRY